MIGLLLAGLAWGGSVAATVDVASAGVDAEVARSLVWHELASVGIGPTILDVQASSAAPQMVAMGATTLFDVDVTWERGALWHDARVVWASAPRVVVTEYVLRDGGLFVVTRREHLGAPQLDAHLALERAVAVAFDAPAVPEWGPRLESVRVPIVLLADEEFRSRYGQERWVVEARDRLERASALLEPAGVSLQLVSWGPWTTPDDTSRPEALLERLAALPSHDNALRVGMSGQGDELMPGSTDDVGAAYVPGSHIVVMDHGPDIALEGISLAHEILHALGALHADTSGLLTSAIVAGPVYRIDRASLELAGAAARARWAPGEPEADAILLAAAADQWIADEQVRLVYVARTLAAREGATDLSAPRWAALAREALDTEGDL